MTLDSRANITHCTRPIWELLKNSRLSSSFSAAVFTEKEKIIQKKLSCKRAMKMQTRRLVLGLVRINILDQSGCVSQSDVTRVEFRPGSLLRNRAKRKSGSEVRY